MFQHLDTSVLCTTAHDIGKCRYRPRDVMTSDIREVIIRVSSQIRVSYVCILMFTKNMDIDFIYRVILFTGQKVLYHRGA